MGKGSGGGGRMTASQRAKAAYHKAIGLGRSTKPISSGGSVNDSGTDIGFARAVLASKSLGAPVSMRDVRAATRTLERAGIVVRR